MHDTKLKVLKAASELISAQGYHNVSVREICEAAGVTKPVLYYYFKDKEDLLAELLSEGHKRFIELMNTSINPSAGFEENLDALYNVYLNYTETYPYLIRVSVHVQFSPLPEKIKSFYAKKSKEIMELFNEIFSKGIKEGYFKKDIELEMLVYSLVSPLGALIAQSVILKHNVKPLKDSLKRYFDFWKSQFLKKEK